MSKTLYETIFENIRDEINRGKYKTGEMLPSENALAKSFSTTRMTVRLALTRLRNEGYIYPVAGKGYYVKEKKYNKYLFKFDEKKVLDNEVEESKLLSVDIIRPDVDLSYNLKLPGDSRIVAIKRLLFMHGKRVAYDEKFIPYYSGIPIQESDINYATLQQLISDKTSLFSIKNNLIIKVIENDEEMKEIFKPDSPSFLFRVEHTILDDEMEPVAWAKTTYIMEYFKINGNLIINK